MQRETIRKKIINIHSQEIKHDLVLTNEGQSYNRIKKIEMI